MQARDYRRLYPLKIVAFSVVPRVVLQTAFMSYLGYYAAGVDGRRFAFVGAAMQIMTMGTVVKGSDAILDERVFGTLYRTRIGVLALPGTTAARWLVYSLEGFCASVVAVLVLAAPFGGAHLLLRLLAAVPLFALLALTTSAFGLAVGSLALSYRADVLITNFASYALLVLCGAVAPLSAFGPAEPAMRLLPLTNGLLAVRHAIAGGPWLGDAALELAVGVAWALVALALLARQERRAVRLGTDDLI